MTCISRKVKCDEQRPLCGGCRRLSIQCNWRQTQPQLSVRRKGTGLIRDRDKTNWKPPKILPVPRQNEGGLQSIRETSEDSATSNWAANSPLSSMNDQKALIRNEPKSGIPLSLDISATDSLIPDQTSMLELSENPMTYLALANMEFQRPVSANELAINSGLVPETWMDMDGKDISVQEALSSASSMPGILTEIDMERLVESSDDQGEVLSSEIISRSTPLIPDLLSRLFVRTNAANPLNSYIPISDDSQALFYFRDTFARLKSMRDPQWSVHEVFLHYASQRQMAMHFLLAVSHHELVMNQGLNSRLPDEARGHYETGSQLLYQSMTGRRSTDHMGVLMSFLYMYVFWIRRDVLQSKRLRPLSRSVYNYVKALDVDALVTSKGSSPTLFSPYPSLELEVEDQVPNEIILSRLLVYLYDRDVYCSFYGSGGYFANYIDTDEERRQAIWVASRGSLQRYWGKLYPITEALQDFDDEMIQGMHFDLIIMQQLINDYSRHYQQDAEKERQASLTSKLDSHRLVSMGFFWLVRKILIVTQKYASVFQIVITEDVPSCSLSLLAYVSVTMFYALRIYLLRCSSTGFGGYKSAALQEALEALISAAHHTLAKGPITLSERFQWSLLIAGTETNSIIYQEWIASKISDTGIQNLLKLIQGEKKRSGGEITISRIRQMVGGEA